MAAAPDILRLLPQPRPDDPPELANALTQAYELWSRGRRSDAVTVLRGAIVSAAEHGAPDRANDLARQVTELVNALHGPPAPPPKLDRPSGTMAKPPPPPPRARIPATSGSSTSVPATSGPSTSVPATSGRSDTGARPIVSEKPPQPKPAEPTHKTTEKPAGNAFSNPPPRTAGGAPSNEAVDASWTIEPPPNDVAFAPAPVLVPAPAPAPAPLADEASKDDPPPTRPGGDDKKPIDAEPNPEDLFGPIDLSKVEILADVPDDALMTLIERAQRCKLAAEERVDAPAMIVVVEGALEIGVAGREAAVEFVDAGQAKILAPPKPSRDALIVTAVRGPARYLALDNKAIEALRASAPWVVSELTAGCDALHSLAGVLAGPFGKGLTSERVAELRTRCEPRRLAKNALVIKEGERVRGLMLVGAGAVVGDGDAPLSAGDVVLGAELVEGDVAPASLRAGPEGALLLVARRPQTKQFLADAEWTKRFRGD